MAGQGERVPGAGGPGAGEEVAGEGGMGWGCMLLMELCVIECV